MDCVGMFIAGFLCGIAVIFCWCAVCIADEDRYGGDK